MIDENVWKESMVFAALFEAAQRELPCPTNMNLSQSIGVSDSIVARVIRKLASDGKIKVEMGNYNRRVITICKTGLKTRECVPKKFDQIQREIDGPLAQMERHTAQLEGHRFEDVVLKPRRVLPRFIPTPFPVFSHGVSHGYGK